MFPKVHIKVLHEDENFLALNKPAGLLVHGAHIREHGTQNKKTEPTLVDWLREHRPEVNNVGDDPTTRPGIVHRLDRDTSGVMLVAKTQEYFLYLKGLFQRHEMKKTYLALVRGKLGVREGVIDKPIGIVSGSTKRSVRSTKMQKLAVTEYEVIREITAEDGSACSLLEVRPKTGRTHQIRVHLASIGHPVIGDPIYGTRNKEHGSRLMLHALSIEFSPTPGKRLKIEAEPPPGFVQ